MSRQSNSDHRSAVTRRSLLASAALLITTAGVHARVVTKVLPWRPNEAYPVKPVVPGFTAEAGEIYALKGLAGPPACVNPKYGIN